MKMMILRRPGGSAGDKLVVVDGGAEADWWSVRIVRSGETG